MVSFCGNLNTGSLFGTKLLEGILGKSNRTCTFFLKMNPGFKAV